MTDHPPLNMAYFAYPIDNAPAASMLGFYEFVSKVKQSLLDMGLVAATFDPGDAFSVASLMEPPSHVQNVNDYALLKSDLVVAFLPRGVPTVGVPIEIERACRFGKLVAVLTDGGSYALAGYRDDPRVLIVTMDGRTGMGPYTGEPAIDALLLWLREAPREIPGEEPEALPVLVPDGARLPSRGYPDDAGLDLYTTGQRSILPGEFVDVPCGIRVQLPEWGWGLITGRSSTLRKKGLLVHPGIIDAGWRGELFAGVWNLTDKEVWVEEGERIAQLIVMPNLTKDLNPVQVEGLDPHDRGTNGFGSTGN